MIELAETVFGQKLESDPRLPLFYFSIPLLGHFGCTGIVPQFWLQVCSLGIIHIFINFLAATLAYKFLVKNPDSLLSKIVGFGVICPLLVLIPFRLIEDLDLRNPVLKLVTVSNPALLLFRCFETMYGNLPKFAVKNRKAFLWYFAATVEFNVDPKTQAVVRTSTKEFLQKASTLVLLFFECAALFSILVPFDYAPFPSRKINSFVDIFFIGNMINTFLMAALTKTTIEFGTSLQGLLVSCFSGYSTGDINIRPLTGSTSPSDFWGRRWNRLVSGGLKRGIYKPFRQRGFSKGISALATFAFSGVLHEYFLAATTFGGNHAHDSAAHSLDATHLMGGHLIFFLWNALILILDGLCRETKPIRVMEESLPQLLRTALVLMTVLPVAHFFLDQFISIGYYSGFSLGYPRIVPINVTSTPAW